VAKTKDANGHAFILKLARKRWRMPDYFLSQALV